MPLSIVVRPLLRDQRHRVQQAVCGNGTAARPLVAHVVCLDRFVARSARAANVGQPVTGGRSDLADRGHGSVPVPTPPGVPTSPRKSWQRTQMCRRPPLRGRGTAPSGAAPLACRDGGMLSVPRLHAVVLCTHRSRGAREVLTSERSDIARLDMVRRAILHRFIVGNRTMSGVMARSHRPTGAIRHSVDQQVLSFA